MSEHPYSNREIDRFFSEIKEQLDRIEHQTTRTNGRVTRLESWRWLMVGGLAIVTFLFPYLIRSGFFAQTAVATIK